MDSGPERGFADQSKREMSEPGHPFRVERHLRARPALSPVAQDDLRIGVAIRRCRERSGRRQKDIAGAVGVTRQCVSLLERGHVDSFSVRTVRAIAAAVGVDLPFAPRGRGAQLDQLVDEEHSEMVDDVVARLATEGWETMIEFSFNDYGDRGSVDVLAWQAEERALLVVETKSRLADLQQTCRSLDTKARVVPRLAAQTRGWRAASVGVLLVLQESSRERTAVARRAAIFSSSFPARNLEIRDWLRRPSRPLRGLWFLRMANTNCAKRGSTRRAPASDTRRSVDRRKRVPDGPDRRWRQVPLANSHE
jgi:transcriptional regulator with XRE-family HTH domain